MSGATESSTSVKADEMTAPGSQSRRDHLSLRVHVRIAEFNQLRQEINLYHDHQKEEIYFAMITLGGIFATMLAKDLWTIFPEVFLVFPFIFCSLALAYADRTVRILRIAAYLHQNLRENLVKDLGTRELLQWEVFKRYRVFSLKEESQSSKATCLQGRISLWFRRNLPELPLLLDVSRVAQFVVPSVMCIMLFLLLYQKPLDILRISVLILATCAALVPIYLFAKSEETSGISIMPVGRQLAEWEEKQLGVR
jgi:hypothetical protein